MQGEENYQREILFHCGAQAKGPYRWTLVLCTLFAFGFWNIKEEKLWLLLSLLKGIMGKVALPHLFAGRLHMLSNTQERQASWYVPFTFFLIT
jgi:hypothetical protein